MREIKFKAWHKNERRMFEVYGLTKNHVIENSWDSPDQTCHPKEDCVVMQYIGHKDKNDEEIYEGYYVLISHPGRLQCGRASVFLIQESRDLWGYDFYWQAVAGYHCSTHILEHNYSNCLIVGNKYENTLPEIVEIARTKYEGN